MDDADRAQRSMERLEQAAATHRKPEYRLPFTGHCHNCGDSVPEPQRFCDPDCSDDFERRQADRARRR